MILISNIFLIIDTIMYLNILYIITQAFLFVGKSYNDKNLRFLHTW